MINNPIMSNINWRTKTISFNAIYKSSNVQKQGRIQDLFIGGVEISSEARDERSE